MPESISTDVVFKLDDGLVLFDNKKSKQPCIKATHSRSPKSHSVRLSFRTYCVLCITSASCTIRSLGLATPGISSAVRDLFRVA